MASKLDLMDLPAGPGRADVPCAVLLPEALAGRALPLCLLLHGGRSSRDILVRMREPITTWWEERIRAAGLPIYLECGDDDPAQHSECASF